MRNGQAEARLATYRLMEALQGHDHARAARDLAAVQVQAEAAGWPEVGLLASIGRAMEGVIRPDDPEGTRRQLSQLIARSRGLGNRALEAHALGLRAIISGVLGETEAVLADAGRGVVLLETGGLPALDACTALVVCAAAYNSLSLWELVDSLYDQAAAMAPDCEEPIQAAAIAVNRVLIRLEWASSLLERDQPDDAHSLLLRATDAVTHALAEPRLPELWRTDMEAAATALRLYLEPAGDIDQLLDEARSQRRTLHSGDDLEMLPLHASLIALALLRAGRAEAAAEWATAESGRSSTSGAHSLQLWTRARVLAVTAGPPDPALDAMTRYAELLASQREEARRALLAAATSRIAVERLSTERDKLARDVALDPLTALSNRRAFDKWLTRDLTRPRSSALIIMDLDEFKDVNDDHGHAVGDAVLRRVGGVIAQHVRGDDLALRLGGDEFAIILETDNEAVGELAVVAARRAQLIGEAIAAEDWSDVATTLRVTVTTGVAAEVLGAHSPAAAKALYDSADRELYSHKVQHPLRSTDPAET